MARQSNFGSVNSSLGRMTLIIILIITIGLYLLSTYTFPKIYTTDRSNIPTNYIWPDVNSSKLLADAATISDVSKLWKSGELTQPDGTKIGSDYKYMAVTVTDGGSLDNYGYYFLFGKELPNRSTKYSNQNALYGGAGWGGAVTYKAGRKPDSPFALKNMLLPNDTWGGTTWAIYKL